VTGWHQAAGAELRATVGVPEGWDLAGLAIVGTPVGKFSQVRRKPVAEVAALDTWDSPCWDDGALTVWCPLAGVEPATGHQSDAIRGEYRGDGQLTTTRAWPKVSMRLRVALTSPVRWDSTRVVTK